MKKTYLSFIYFLLFAFVSTAQVNTFNRQFLFNIDFGGVDFNALNQTYDKGYVFVRGTADTINFVTHRYLELVKLNREGDVSWVKKLFKGYQSTTHAAFNTVTQNSTNGIVVGTSEYQTDSSKIVLVCMDSTGNVEWSKKYPGAISSFVHKILPTSDGGYFVSGSTIDYNKLEYAYAFKVNSTGQYVWGKKILKGSDTLARFVNAIEIPGEGFIATGSSGRQALVVKFDYMGNVVWDKHMFGYSGLFYGLTRLSDSSLVIAGTYADSLQAYKSRLCLVKMDAQGNLLWQKGIQENSGMYAGSYVWDVKTLPSNDLIFVGYVMDPIPTTLLTKFDENGNIIGTKEYRHTFHSFSNTPSSMVLTKDDGVALYALGGTFTNGRSTFSSELLKLDANGFVGCEGANYNLQLKNLNYVTASGITISNCGKDTLFNPVITNISIHDSILCENIQDPNILSVEENSKSKGMLFQNYPNPSNGSTVIEYSLYKTVNDCTLEIYDSKGILIHHTKLGNQFEGTHSIDLDLKLSSGVYFYCLIIEGGRLTKSMLIEN